MRVLFLAGTQLSPKASLNTYGGGGWMESLQCKLKAIGVNVGFAYLHTEDDRFDYGGYSYYCIKAPHKTMVQKIAGGLNVMNLCYDKKRDEVIMRKIQMAVDNFKPDIIHVFGSEPCYGLITQYTDVPVVIHLQGILNVCWNALLTPGVSLQTYCFQSLNPRKIWSKYQEYWEWYRTCAREREILRNCKYFIGRTAWDNGCVDVLTKNFRYFYGGEILRNEFYEEIERSPSDKLTIVTTISAAIYKGYDMILKTARVLKDCMGDNFTWKVYGNVDPYFYERHLKMTHEDVNVELCGVASPKQLVEVLSNCTLYFHSSYIENSPNSVCEAQMISCPVVACFVGGLDSLVKHGEEGFLVPANDPYIAASRIMQLHKDKVLNERMGIAGKITAVKRHDKDMIVKGLMDIYNKVIELEVKYKEEGK